MATMTRADIANLALEMIGVKAPQQSAAAADTQTALEAVDAAHDELIKRGLADFAIATVPTWAYRSLARYVAADIAQDFGLSGERLQVALSGKQRALRELAVQVQGGPELAQAKARFF